MDLRFWRAFFLFRLSTLLSEELDDDDEEDVESLDNDVESLDDEDEDADEDVLSSDDDDLTEGDEVEEDEDDEDEVEGDRRLRARLAGGCGVGSVELEADDLSDS